MNALEFLNNKGIKTPTVNTTRLPDGEFGLHSVTDLMDEYLEYKLKNLSQHLVIQCTQFQSSLTSSSATKCVCGKEKYEHEYIG